MRKFFRMIWEGCIAWGDFMNEARRNRLKAYNQRHWYY